MSHPTLTSLTDLPTTLRNFITAPGATITALNATETRLTLAITWPAPVTPRLSIFLDATHPTDLILHADDHPLASWTLQDPRSYTLDIPGDIRTTLSLTLDITSGLPSLRTLSITPINTNTAPAPAEPLPDLSTLDDATLIRSFESIGNNCELGIVQRELGAEPLDLYRFSAVPLGWILYGMDRAFAGIDASDPHEVTLEHRPDGQHYYYVWQREYRIQYETGIRQDLKTPAAMKGESLRRMHYLSWRLMGSLAEGRRIFTYRSERRLEQAELDAFSDRLQSHGPAFGLVVHEADDAHPPGHMEWVAPNLLRATLHKFANPACVVETIQVAPWLALCREAYRLIAERRAIQLSTTSPTDN